MRDDECSSIEKGCATAFSCVSPSGMNAEAVNYMGLLLVGGEARWVILLVVDEIFCA